jgi:DNA replication and repair protein RecF
VLRSLKVRHFRCFDAFEAEFDAGLNLIVGPERAGEDLAARSRLHPVRLQSPRVTRLAHVIQHERRGFVADGYFGARRLQFYFSRERKKLALDEVEQKSAHEYLQIGRLVYFSNSDIEIVRGSGEVRRRFLDFVALQREPGYRGALRSYERALRARNLLLKAVAPRWREIEAFDEPLITAGNALTAAREGLVADLQPLVNTAHHAISGARETVELTYLSGASADFRAALTAARGGCTAAANQHRSASRRRAVFAQWPGSEFASEGQQRTLVLALKLAAARLLEEHFKPRLCSCSMTFSASSIATAAMRCSPRCRPVRRSSSRRRSSIGCRRIFLRACCGSAAEIPTGSG